MKVCVAIAAVLLLAGASSAAVQNASVAVTESVSPDHAAPGENVTISFAATSSGPDDQSPFTLVLFLGLHWKLTGSAPSGCVKPNDFDIECHFATFANGQSTPTYSVTATPDADQPAGAPLESRVIAFPCDCSSGGGMGSAAAHITVDAPPAPPPPSTTPATPPPPPPPPPPPASTHALTVTLVGAGTGTVTSTPAGISCPQTCTATFAPGTAVSLIAAPGLGASFGGWTGACRLAATVCALTTDQDKAVVAEFDTLVSTPPVGAPPIVCTVPKLAGLTLPAVRARLARAHCSLGATTRRHAAARLAGRVVAQRPAAGEYLSRNGKVAVVLGRL